jgi:serine/threonine-protein kinase
MKKSQFKIEQKLNESGTTVVYKAFDEVLHRNVLLKVLHKHLANDDELRQRFVREARACAALQSEHIVQVYDLTEIDGAPAIVMEFIEGRSLKEVIASGDSKNFEFTKKAAVHILRGLTIAHERGIIHRDIKPGNILVSDQGVLKVTDFGLAYVALSTTVTMEGMVLGTPAYMAPEQVRGDEIDVRTDLFALGLTLVEILSGERIFEGSTYSECMKKVLAFKVDELKRFESISDPEFSSFLEKLLHPEKEGRFPSAGEALKSIGDKKYFNDVPPASASPKKRLFVIGIAAVVLALLVVFGWISVSRQTLPEETTGNRQLQSITGDSMNVKKVQTDDPPIEAVKKQSPAVISEQGKEKNIIAVSKDSGKVYLTSTPWAKVYVNNQLIGETPIARPVILASGSHTVMFANPSFDPIVKTIIVESNREVTVTGNFLEQAGYLQCNVTPWAEVFVDELYKDTTPLSKPMMLSAGRHSVRFRNSAFSDIVKDITVKAKDTTQLTISFHQ